MSIIPLHLQRRFEQRWAGRFGSMVIPAKERRIEKLTTNIAPRAALAKKTRQVESAGLKSASTA